MHCTRAPIKTWLDLWKVVEMGVYVTRLSCKTSIIKAQLSSGNLVNIFVDTHPFVHCLHNYYIHIHTIEASLNRLRRQCCLVIYS